MSRAANDKAVGALVNKATQDSGAAACRPALSCGKPIAVVIEESRHDASVGVVGGEGAVGALAIAFLANQESTIKLLAHSQIPEHLLRSPDAVASAVECLNSLSSATLAPGEAWHLTGLKFGCRYDLSLLVCVLDICLTGTNFSRLSG
jgi:hypothetical protein